MDRLRDGKTNGHNMYSKHFLRLNPSFHNGRGVLYPDASQTIDLKVTVYELQPDAVLWLVILVLINPFVYYVNVLVPRLQPGFNHGQHVMVP